MIEISEDVLIMKPIAVPNVTRDEVTVTVLKNSYLIPVTHHTNTLGINLRIVGELPVKKAELDWYVTGKNCFVVPKTISELMLNRCELDNINSDKDWWQLLVEWCNKTTYTTDHILYVTFPKMQPELMHLKLNIYEEVKVSGFMVSINSIITYTPRWAAVGI